MRLLLIFFFCSTTLSAQEITGKVISADDGKSLEGVTILNKSGNEWAVTNSNGEFKLKLKHDNFELEFKLLGKQTVLLNSEEVKDATNLTIELREDNLKLDDVVVTAVPKRSKIGSAITLGDYAVDQVQSFSLADILQQLPGQSFTPPSLNAPEIISLRTAQPNQINAFGVSFLLDGVPISNDENMQLYNPNPAARLTGYENTSSGIDLRSIPAVNIEEVEVVSGIPDAKYGNLTSGLIRINRKAGVTPFSVNTSLRQGNTNISLSKGFNISDRLGTLSLSLDYLNANSDPRNSLESYDRITGSAIWTIYKDNPNIRNTLSLNLHNNLDDTNYDRDNDDGGRDAKFRKDRGIQIGNRFNWQNPVSFIDNFSFNTGFSYAYQHSYIQSFINDGGKVVPGAMETGLFQANYTPVAYLQIKEVYGQPINFNLSTSVEKLFKIGQTTHNLSFGLDGTYSHNIGKGKAYDPENAHTQLTLRGGGGSLGSGEGMRALDYARYVKPRINMGVYLQNNITHKFDSGNELYANVGLRYDVQNGFSSYSPRVNLGYEITEKISIRGGVGFASKAPSLAQIYPGDKYFDILISDFRTSDYSYNLVQTYNRKFNRLELEPNKSWKYEIGTNYNTSFGRFALTAFYNRTFDGVETFKQRERVDMPNVNFIFAEENLPPTYEITGFSPLILDYSLYSNTRSLEDKGIEFYLNFNKIESINTSFSLNGTYVYTKSVSRQERIIKNSNTAEENLLYGYYDPLPNKTDMLRLRATITHHLSELGLLFSLSAEQFTREMNYASITSIYPNAFINVDGQKVTIAPQDRTNNEYSGLWLNPSQARDILTPSYHNFHLRVTKELANGLSMSLYANNFLNHRPILEIGNSMQRKNALISFGGQIKYQF